MTDKELLEYVNDLCNETDYEIHLWDVWGDGRWEDLISHL